LGRGGGFDGADDRGVHAVGDLVGWHDFDGGEAGGGRVGEGEGFGDVAGVGAVFGAFLRGEVVVGDEVGDADPAAGGQHAVGLGERGGFGDREIDDTVEDHNVDGVGGE
jgi:hypothetical protein